MRSASRWRGVVVCIVADADRDHPVCAEPCDVCRHLLGAGLAAALYGAATFLLSIHGDNKPEALELPTQVFSGQRCCQFMLIVASVMLVSAILSERFGSGAVLPAVTLMVW